jgi:hypothetical protein
MAPASIVIVNAAPLSMHANAAGLASKNPAVEAGFSVAIVINGLLIYCLGLSGFG